MARVLDVYLHKDLAGQLVQDDHGDLSFTYSMTYMEGAQSIPLSNSLPFRPEPFTRRECRGFFSGILPEQKNRELIAKNLGISSKNDFALLNEIGGECAGAITFLPSGEKLPEQEARYRPLSEEALASLLKELPRRPLLAGDQDIRLSLAGAQSKLPVHVVGARISLPLGGAPSTHILKPAVDHFKGMVYNEAFCMNLAAGLKLPVAPVEVRVAEGMEYLLIERYDRRILRLPAGYLVKIRMHQEDFCQALGIVPENKYQNEGGPSLLQCFQLLREISSSPVQDLPCLLDAAIFNFLIGNCDAHGKNFSMTYHEGTLLTGSYKRLAPFYDLVCTVCYPDLSRKMAMKIGREYEIEKIRSSDFTLLAGEAGLSKKIVLEKVLQLAEGILEKTRPTVVREVRESLFPGDTTQTSDAVAAILHRRCQKILLEFKGK